MKRIVIVENFFNHFQVYCNNINGYKKFPSGDPIDDPQENQNWITDIRTYVLSGFDYSFENNLKDQIQNALNGEPNFIILDRSLLGNDKRNEDDDIGRKLKSNFFDKYYKNATILEISQYHKQDKVVEMKENGEPKYIYIPKYERGDDIKDIEITICKYLKKYNVIK